MEMKKTLQQTYTAGFAGELESSQVKRRGLIEVNYYEYEIKHEEMNEVRKSISSSNKYELVITRKTCMGMNGFCRSL